MISLFFFLVFSLCLLVSAVAVILFKDPVHSAISLVFSFVSAACMWLLLHAEFLAIVLILVYVGAVMVLFLFVVMMISRAEQVSLKTHKAISQFVFFAYGAVILLAAELIYALISSHFAVTLYDSTLPFNAGSVSELGHLLFTRYFFPFELAAILLCLGVLSAVIIAHRVRDDQIQRRQEREEQLSVSKKDRLSIVSDLSNKKSDV